MAFGLCFAAADRPGGQGLKASGWNVFSALLAVRYTWSVPKVFGPCSTFILFVAGRPRSRKPSTEKRCFRVRICCRFLWPKKWEETNGRFYY